LIEDEREKFQAFVIGSLILGLFTGVAGAYILTFRHAWELEEVGRITRIRGRRSSYSF
jgi:hypothetical protein